MRAARTACGLLAIVAYTACAGPGNDHNQANRRGGGESREAKHLQQYADWATTTRAAMKRRHESVTSFETPFVKVGTNDNKRFVGHLASQHFDAAVDQEGLRIRRGEHEAQIAVILPASDIESTVQALPKGWVTHHEKAGSTKASWHVDYGLSTHGVVQRFVWEDPPAGADDEAVVTFRVQGLEPVLASKAPGGHAKVALRHDQKVVFWYRGVFAEDADGKPLRAHMDVNGQTIELHVATAAARFPVVVDPLIATETQTIRSPHTSPTLAFVSEFSNRNLALFDDRLVVGARDSATGDRHFDRFDRQADGTWLFVQSAPATLQIRWAGDDWFATETMVWTVASNGLIAASHAPFNCSETNCRVNMLSKDIAVESFSTSWGGAYAPLRLHHRAANDTWSLSHELADACRLQRLSDTQVMTSCGAGDPRTIYDVDAIGGLSNPTPFPSIPLSSGVTIDVSQDRILLGNEFDSTHGDQSGKVDVYRELTPGAWSLVTSVFATNPHTEAGFGDTTTTFGDTLVASAFGGFAWGGLYSYRWSPSSQQYIPGPVLEPLDDADANARVTHAKLGPKRIAAVPHRANDALAGYQGAVHVYRLTTELGDDCTVPEECESGLCVDGRCCDSVCDGPCESCAVTGTAGTCSAIPAGTDPDDECGSDFCGGSGQCARVDGTPCNSGAGCQSGECVDGYCCASNCAGQCGRCDAPGNEGQCVALPAGTSCGSFACDGTTEACPDRCDTTENCAPGFGCTEAGVCAAIQALGATCSADSQCQSGYCVDGTCCNQACDGACATCGGGVCDLEPCGDYICGGSECLNRCDTSADCSTGRQCQANGECVVAEPIAEEAEGSCSVSVNRHGSNGRRGLWLVAGALLFLGRRRFRSNTQGTQAAARYLVVGTTIALAAGSCRAPSSSGSDVAAVAPRVTETQPRVTSAAIIGRRKTQITHNPPTRHWHRVDASGFPQLSWGHHVFRGESVDGTPRLQITGPHPTTTIALQELRRGVRRWPPETATQSTRRGWLRHSIGAGPKSPMTLQVRYGLLESGLLQLVEIPVRPEGPEGEPLAIQFEVTGLKAVVSDPRPDGHARVALRDGTDAKLWLRGAYAVDSAGRPLKAWLTANQRGYAVVVDDMDAEYPIAIDPIVGGSTQVLSSPMPATDDGYGRSVVLHDDLAFVGAPYANADAGAVDVFQRQADGSWLHLQRLSASLPGDEEFGDDIAFENDDLLVMSGGGPTALTVLKRGPNGLFTQQHRFEIRSFSASKRAEVRVANGVAVVTTSSASDGVQLYVRDQAGQWSFDTVVLPSFGAYFGSIAAIWDDHLAVSRCRGSAEVAIFDRQADGSWLEIQLINAANDTLDIGDAEYFGCTMAGFGDRLAIGSYGDDLGGYGSGSVHVFEDIGGTWTATASLTMPNSHPRERFGRSVAINGGFLAVGAVGHLVSGAVQTYRLGANYEPGLPFIDPMAVAGHHLGRATSLWENRLAAGAKRFEFGESTTPPGAAYVTILAESLGTTCTLAEDCASGLCIDGVCCDAPCNGTCERCDQAPSPGTCTPISLGLDPDDECGADAACDGSGACRGIDGAGCAASAECLSGECASGTCCNRPCGGACEACDLSGSEGTCELLPPSTDSSACVPFACDGQSSLCPSSCVNDGECATGFYCDGSTCIDGLPNGSLACERDGQCLSGQCVDGQCCDAACDGECQQCVSGSCRANECGGFMCRVEPPERGACLTACASSADCRGGFQCNAAGQCVAPEVSADDETGGCSVGRPTRHANFNRGWWLLAAALATRMRRRRDVV